MQKDLQVKVDNNPLTIWWEIKKIAKWDIKVEKKKDKKTIQKIDTRKGYKKGYKT